MKPINTFKQKVLALMLTMAALAALHTSAWAAGTFSVTSATSGTTTTFTITRTDATTAQEVRYRTVDITALRPYHYDGAAGRLTFAVGETSKTVTVTEVASADITNVLCRYQSGTRREYRFEVTDMYGFLLAETTRRITYSSAYQFSNNHINRNPTPLVYINKVTYDSTLGSSQYYDVQYAASTNNPITVTDGGYQQAVHTVPLSGIFTAYSQPADYLNAIGDKLYATVCFYSSDVQDGYHYIQVLADNATTYDGNDPNGAVNTPSTSLYKACFEEYVGNMEGRGYWFFPHFYDYQTYSEAESAGVSTDPYKEFYVDQEKLWEQEFRNASVRSSSSGALVLPTTTSELNIRFDAAGSGDDDWTFKDLFVRLALADDQAPLLRGVGVSEGPYYQHNRVTITLLFSEIVKPTGSTLVLRTSWGDFTCDQFNSSEFGNALSFTGIITANTNTTLQLSSITSGNIVDLIGNTFTGSLAQTISGKTVATLPAPPLVGGVYQISTVSELYAYADLLAANPTRSAVLTADIDISTTAAASGFTAMGGTSGFAGTFDGQGHTISGLQNISAVNGGAGLFGRIATGGKVCNLYLIADMNQIDLASVGGICGINQGIIEQCSVGGYVGTSLQNASSATTSNCMGGLCGENQGTVRNCYTTCEIYHRWQNAPASGLVGRNTAAGTIENCFFYGSFSSHNAVTRGAICGENAGTVRNCYGLHSNSNYLNGAVGSNSGTVETTEFPEDSDFARGRICYLLNGGVVDGTQVWYQRIDSNPKDSYPLFDTTHPVVYQHGDNYYNGSFSHSWNEDWHWTSREAVTLTITCSVCQATETFNLTSEQESVRRYFASTSYSTPRSTTQQFTDIMLFLVDNGDNQEAIQNYRNSFNNIMLEGRTLYKDGGWNTLCLPFALASFTGTPLEGATVKTLESSSFSGGTLTLNFTDAESIIVDKPYLVKWDDGDDIVNPIFRNVYLPSVHNYMEIETDIVTFVGIFNRESYDRENRSILLMGADNKLFYPDGSGLTWLNAFRAYFQLKDGYTAGEPTDQSAGIRAFDLNFGDDDATGISLTSAPSPKGEGSSYWYTIDGRRLSGKPTQQGVYVNNGRKIVIK